MSVPAPRVPSESTAAPRPPLLVVHPGAELYGADRVLLESATALATRFTVTVAVPGPGPLVGELEARGVRVQTCPMPVLRNAALRVTVRVENGTAEPVALGGVAVNLAYGPDRTPASPLDDPSRRPFATMVEPGESAEGVYVFTVPADERDRVAVEVGYEAGAPLLLFTGPVA